MASIRRMVTGRAGLIVVAAMAVAAHGCGLLLIAGAHVVPGWALGAALLVAALIAGPTRSSSGPAGTAATTGSPRWMRALTSLTVVGCLVGGAADVSASYHLLKPAGPGGCRAVVRETAFLFAGSGAVYTGYVAGPIGAAWRGSSWTADDGYRPIADGTYELRWGLGGGILVVSGTDGNPVWPALHDVDCG
jgi:hypothetical protein